jgi:tripartite ATP-independent transporter DctM subunit
MVIAVFLVLLLFLIASGLPLFACFSIVCIGLIYTLGIDPSFAIPSIFVVLNSFTMLAIPLFVFAGGLMNTSGISEKIIDFANAMVGRFKGGLGAVTILSCGFFGAISGSSGAAISGIGMAMLPQLDKFGYTRRYSSALLACSGLLGQLIPPSIPLILFGMITGTSVAACWLGAAVPGILLIVLYVFINRRQTRKMPEIQQLEKVSARRAVRDVGTSARKGLSALLMPVVILGGIYSGTFTPTEAGAVAVVYALVVGFFINRKLTLKNLFSQSQEVISVLGSITFIIMFILILSRLFTYERVPMALGELIMGLSSNKVAILLLINLLVLIIGMFMDDISSMLICAPLLFPLFQQLGISPIQMAVILTVNQGTGMLTPPVATNLYIASRVGNVPASDFISLTLPFLLFGNVPLLLMVTFVPELSLWLPRWLMGIG